MISSLSPTDRSLYADGSTVSSFDPTVMPESSPPVSVRLDTLNVSSESGSVGEPPEEALLLAAKLALEGRFESRWQVLDGSEVWVFEDSTGELESLMRASELLEAQGVTIQTHLVGIARDARKRHALANRGAEVFADLRAALQEIL